MRPSILVAAALGLSVSAVSPFLSAASPTTVYVRTDGNNTCDGSGNTPYNVTLHCAKRTIQAGIGAVEARGTVRVGAGTFVENVIVDKAVTVWGAGKGQTTVIPATSNANPCTTSSLCGGMASNVFLVRSSDVAIQALTVDGDNPTKKGVTVGGIGVDARNGIIEDHLTGVYSRLTVTSVEVKNVFLRGINAASGGNDFAFKDNYVHGVQGSDYSVAIFAFDSRGVISDNHVVLANDAISLNYSRGVQIANNLVELSGTGIHIDNNRVPETGIPDDVIQNNTVINCTAGGFGIWLLVPHANAVVEYNTVTTCPVGLALVGGGTTSDILFDSNTLTGNGASGTVGILVTTDTTNYGDFDAVGAFTNNVVKTFDAAAMVFQQNGKTTIASFNGERYDSSVVGLDNHGIASVQKSCLINNIVGVLNEVTGETGVQSSNIVNNTTYGFQNLADKTLDATNNWWGDVTGPAPKGAGDEVSGAIDYEPFLTSAPVACD